MKKTEIGKRVLDLVEKNAEKNAGKYCRTLLYEPPVPEKLRKKGVKDTVIFKLFKKSSALMMVLMILCYSQIAYAEEDADMCERTEDEVDELIDIYQDLFPDEYHYIETYVNEGVDTTIENPQIIFEETESDFNTDYTLIVYDNNQILTVVSTTNSSSYAASTLGTNGGSSVRYTVTYDLGDLNVYERFTGIYRINKPGYDSIESFEATKGPWIVPSYSKKVKEKEDSSGAAYIAYPNCYMSLYGVTYYYDFGLAVGKDKASPQVQLSTGWDVFLYRLLDAFGH